MQELESSGLFCSASEIHRYDILCHYRQCYTLSHLFIITFRDCLKFCFMHLIEKDLGRAVSEWNTHRIRPSSNSSPPGHPDELFFMPQLIGMHAVL